MVVFDVSMPNQSSYKLQATVCLCTRRSMSPPTTGDQDRRQFKELQHRRYGTRHSAVRLLMYHALDSAKVTPN